MLLLTVSTLLKIIFVLVLIASIAPILVWAERRQSAMIQDRVGPVRAGVPLPKHHWPLVVVGILITLGGFSLGAVASFFMLEGAELAWGFVPVFGSIAQVISMVSDGMSGSRPMGLELGLFAFLAVNQLSGVALALFGQITKINTGDFIRGPAALGAKAMTGLALVVGALAVIALGSAMVGRSSANSAIDRVEASEGPARLIAVENARETLGGSMWAGDDVFPRLGWLDSNDSLPRLRDTVRSAYAPHIQFYGWLLFICLMVAAVHWAAAWLLERAVDARDELTVFGLIHPLADVIKMIWKEDFAPPAADKLLYTLAPIIALVPAFATFAVIPFGADLYWGPEGDSFAYLFSVVGAGAADGAFVAPADARVIPLQVASINVGILYIFAIAGTGIVGAAIAGYSSNNKYALLGGLRAASQMVSYEVTLGLTLVGCFMVYNSLLLDDMVTWQQDHVWGFVVQPLALILFFFASIAEMKRVPFDAPEGESEIVAGYFLEYSGIKFGMFMTGEFVEHVVSSGLIITLFFGGCDVPFLHQDGFRFGEAVGWGIPLPHIVVVLVGIAAFVAKMAVIMFLQLQVRWTLPRFRYDQIMQLCWKIILPLSLANILVTGVVILVLAS